MSQVVHMLPLLPRESDRINPTNHLLSDSRFHFPSIWTLTRLFLLLSLLGGFSAAAHGRRRDGIFALFIHMNSNPKNNTLLVGLLVFSIKHFVSIFLFLDGLDILFFLLLFSLEVD
jgi:hypothetical protein